MYVFPPLQTPVVTLSSVRRKFPRGGPKHRRSQGRDKGAMPSPKFVENIVILCFERRFSKQNSVIRLKLNILVYTAEYWQYTPPKTVYTFFIFRVWGEGHGTVANPFRTLVVTLSLHHLPKMSEVSSHMQKNTLIIVTWSEPLKIRCHVIVTQLRETVEQCVRKFRNVSLQAKEWTWVNCKLITASHQNSEVGFCAVWVPYR